MWLRFFVYPQITQITQILKEFFAVLIGVIGVICGCGFQTNRAPRIVITKTITLTETPIATPIAYLFLLKSFLK